MATYGEWKRIKSEDVGKTQEERAKRAAALRGGDPAIARMNLPYSEPPSTRDPMNLAVPDTYGADYDAASLEKNQPMARAVGRGRNRSTGEAISFASPFVARSADEVKQGVSTLDVQDRAPGSTIDANTLTPKPEAPLPVSNQPQMSQVAQLPLEGGAEAIKVNRPDGSTRWATKNGYMDAATPRATSTNNALGITDEAFSRGGSFSIASGPRGGMSQAEWDGLSQEEATAIRVAGLEKQGQDLRDLRDVRSAADFKAGGSLTEGGRSVLEGISGGAPIEGYTRGTKDWRRENNTGAPTIVGTSFADDFAFADQAEGGGIGKLEDALEDKNPKTRREAINALGRIYEEQVGAQPQAVGPDFGDQLAQAQMQQNAMFKQADLAGKQQDRMLEREQQALENRRAGTEADQAEVKVLTAQLDKVMGSGQVVPGTEGILNEVMLQKRANPLMVNSIIQEALTSLPESKKALANPNTDPKAVKDKQAALAAIRQYVAQKMPAQKMP